MKKTISLIGLILILGCLTGCVFNNNSTRDEIINYMEQKYDDKFTYIDSFGGDNSRVNILLSSKKMPDYKITASRNVDDNGEIYYSDNYTHYKYQKQTKTYLYNIMKEVFNSEIFITYGIGSLGTSNDFTDETTFDNFIRNKDSNILFNVIVNPNYNINETELVNKLKATDIQFTNFTIYFATNEENFKDFTELTSSELEQMRKLNVLEDFSKVEWK